jgi:hypothetical protein
LLGLRDRPQLRAPDSDPFQVLPVWARSKPSIAPSGREVIVKSLLTISAKPVLVGAAFQPLMPNGRTIWIADAHRDDGKRFIVHADELLTAFLELEAAICACGE